MNFIKEKQVRKFKPNSFEKYYYDYEIKNGKITEIGKREIKLEINKYLNECLITNLLEAKDHDNIINLTPEILNKKPGIYEDISDLPETPEDILKAQATLQELKRQEQINKERQEQINKEKQEKQKTTKEKDQKTNEEILKSNSSNSEETNTKIQQEEK